MIMLVLQTTNSIRTPHGVPHWRGVNIAAASFRDNHAPRGKRTTWFAAQPTSGQRFLRNEFAVKSCFEGSFDQKAGRNIGDQDVCLPRPDDCLVKFVAGTTDRNGPILVRQSSGLGWLVFSRVCGESNILGFLGKGTRTPMAQGRSTKVIPMIQWIRTSRLSVNEELSLGRVSTLEGTQGQI